MEFKNGQFSGKTKGSLDHGWARLWIGFACWASISGWLLSLLDNLTPFGYSVSFIIFGGLAWHFRSEWGFSKRSFTFQFLKKKRWRPLFPFCFLILFVLSLVGGALYAPNNYDFLSYRFSRMLHWWAEGGWIWIDTGDHRMNYSGTTFEWLVMPFFQLSGSDRFIFLVNIFSFALFPGLLFSVFRDLGIGGRTAWHWMWVFPAGYCYVMQAGSASNDALAAVFLLASIHFFCRSARGGGTRDFWWGMLAAALLTGTKLSNLPLLLPCLVAALPSLKGALRKPGLFLLFWSLGAVISIIPIVSANVVHTGHWTGDPSNSEKMQLKNPVAAFLGNSLQLTTQNLTPPLLPNAGNITRRLNEVLPDSWKEFLKVGFPRFALEAGELPQEENSGMGLGITALLVLTLGFGLWHWRTKRTGTGVSLGQWVGLAAWLSALVFMMKMGSECTGRLLCSYYPLLIVPVLLLADGTCLIRTRWWRAVALLIMVSTVIPLILTPSRPLFPALGILKKIREFHPQNTNFQRAEKVYQVYTARADVLALVREKLDADVKVVGFLGSGDDVEISLWRSFGTRAVIAPEKSKNIPEWIVINTQGVQARGFESVEDWLHENNYQSVTKVPITSKVREGAVEWTIARSDSEPPWRSPLDSFRLPAWSAFLAVGLALVLTKVTERYFKHSPPGENLLVMSLLKAWLFWSGGMVLSGWLLSSFKGLAWIGVLALFFGACVFFRLYFVWQMAGRREREEIFYFLGYPPWLILSGTMILACLLYSPVTLDSLTYRIPRILYWLQEGGFSFMPGCDPRLNYMTPNWEWTALPSFMVGSDRFLRLPGFISWVILYLVFCSWAKNLFRDSSRVRIGAFLCVAASVWVLQGASSVNDIFAASLLLLSLFFITRFESFPSFSNLALSAFALGMAAGTKPHFSVMALPWGLWFLFSPSRPWRQVRTLHLVWFVPVALVTGPLPTFVINQLHYGSWKGESEDPLLSCGHWLANLVLGSVMMLWQMIQLPLNPLFNIQNRWSDDWIEKAGLHDWVPRFSLDCKVAMIVDGASFGLVSSLVLAIGLWMFFKRKNLFRDWTFYAGLAGLLGFFIAISQVVPGTAGRSFSGFVLLLFPAALMGLERISDRTILVLGIAALFSCLFSLAFSASHPLWPVKTLVGFLEKNHAESKLLDSAKKYADFSLRYDTARDLVRQVPESEEVLLAIVPADRPLLQLWEPYRYHRKVITFNKDVTPKDIADHSGRYLIVGPGFGEFYPQLVGWVMGQKDFTEIASGSYTSKLERGPESWRLFKRKE